MGQARDGAGQFARHLGVPGHNHLSPFTKQIDLKGDPVAPNVIASRDVIVHDPNLDIDRKLFAGQPVPPDLVKVYEEAVGKPAAEEQHDRKTAGGIEDAIESGQDTESPKRSGRGRSNG